jgi:hypothetical protein
MEKKGVDEDEKEKKERELLTNIGLVIPIIFYVLVFLCRFASI